MVLHQFNPPVAFRILFRAGNQPDTQHQSPRKCRPCLAPSHRLLRSSNKHRSNICDDVQTDHRVNALVVVQRSTELSMFRNCKEGHPHAQLHRPSVTCLATKRTHARSDMDLPSQSHRIFLDLDEEAPLSFSWFSICSLDDWI